MCASSRPGRRTARRRSSRWHNPRIASASVSTGWGTSRTGNCASLDNPFTNASVCSATWASVSSPYKCWLPVTNHNSSALCVDIFRYSSTPLGNKRKSLSRHCPPSVRPQSNPCRPIRPSRTVKRSGMDTSPAADVGNAATREPVNVGSVSFVQLAATFHSAPVSPSQ